MKPYNAPRAEISSLLLQYAADSHIGTLQKPVRLIISQETDSVYKTIENGNVIIIRDGERYDMTGKRLNR